MDSQDVNVTNEDPLKVAIERGPADPLPVTVAKSVKAQAQVDADILTTAGQRRVNIIWERTQQIIALSVVWAALFVAIFITMASLGTDPTTASVAFVFLSSVSNLVIGFYFGRTNHQKVGGVGSDEVAGR